MKHCRILSQPREAKAVTSAHVEFLLTLLNLLTGLATVQKKGRDGSS